MENKNNEDYPLISIITVVFNGEDFLEETIQSVLNQTYRNIEYIIIDGASTDGTLEIIKKYKSSIDYFSSEKDKGIYDAMNKGIDAANGNWINFMNAGDKFYDSTTCSNTFNNNKYSNDVDILYGDLIVDYGEFQRLENARSINSIWKGIPFSHQSSFIKTAYHKNNKYSLNYKIGGDFEFFYKSFNEGRGFKYIGHIVSIMGVDGLSDGNRFYSIWQKHQIVNDYSFSLKYNMYYIYLYIDQLIRNFFKMLLPSKIINLIKAKGIY